MVGGCFTTKRFGTWEWRHCRWNDELFGGGQNMGLAMWLATSDHDLVTTQGEVGELFIAGLTLPKLAREDPWPLAPATLRATSHTTPIAVTMKL